MKLIRIPALLLAAALQLLPMCRTVCTSPAFSSTLAIIFRWTIGAGAAVTAYDAYSAGSTVYIDSPTTAVGTVGVPFTYYITLGGKVGTDSGSIVAGAPLPAGFTNYTMHHLTSPVSEWGVISGTPSSTMTNFLINLAASNPNYNSGVPVTGSLRLTVYPTSTPVVIGTNPTNVTATNNQNVSFTVTAPGTGPLTYQWFKSDTNIWNHIPDATNATYAFKASTNSASGSFAVNAGNYLVRISGAAGMISSAPATLSVGSGAAVVPSITTQPTNQTVTAGLPVTYFVAASGTAPFTYQWRKNSTNVSAAATNSSWSLANARLADAGTYTVVVSNSVGGITSSNAQLTVTVPSAPALLPLAPEASTFRFTFTPVVGLTNSVLTNGTVGSGWSVLTNIPPPATAASITVTDLISGSLKFYRVSFSP